jgi:hypothetical protein
MAGMRMVGILAVVAVIGFAYSRRGKVDAGRAELDEIMGSTPTPVPAAIVSGAITPAPSAESSSGLRRPIDTTKRALEQVKGRNGNGEF